MKKIIILFLLIGNSVYSQENRTFDELLNLKNKLTSDIQLLKDSLTKINQEIDLIKSKEFLEKVSKSDLISVCKKNAKLKNEPEAYGKIIKTYTTEEKVIILDYYGGYFGVCIGSDYGYMSELWINISDEIKAYIKSKEVEKARLKAIAIEKENTKNKLDQEKLEKDYLKRFGKETYDKLKKGFYWIGMTSEMAVISLGYPEKINRSVGTWGVHEQWIYGDTYLYFENDILSSYQN